MRYVLEIFITAQGDGEKAKEKEDEESAMSVSGDSLNGEDQN